MSGVEIISVHVPKTAGTTLRNLLFQVYEAEQVCCDYPGKGYKGAGTTEITEATKVVHGHFFVRKYADEFPDAKKIAWVRHPISRLISHYYYWKTAAKAPIEMKDLSFTAFAETQQMQNRMARFLRGVKLTQFYFLGIQEFFSEDLAELQAMLNWPSVDLERTDNRLTSPEYHDLCNEVLSDTKLMSTLIDLNREDMDLYEKVLTLRNKRVDGITGVHQFYLNWQRSKLQVRQLQAELALANHNPPQKHLVRH